MYEYSGVTLPNKKIDLHPHTTLSQKNRKEIQAHLFFLKKEILFNFCVEKQLLQTNPNPNSSQRSKLLLKSNSSKHKIWGINLEKPRLHAHQVHQKQVKWQNVCITHFS
jgi:hypothetical protein